MPGNMKPLNFPRNDPAIFIPNYTSLPILMGGNNRTPNNDTQESLPKEIQFTEDGLVSVIAYSVLFLVAAVGNLTVFITLFRGRHRKSRVNHFIMHLSIADLIVTFVMLPMEIGWHLTVGWKAGDIGCRILMFCRAFGFYLSSFVLIAISLDRYFAIMQPLSMNDAGKRSKIMLCLAWIISAIASLPQSVIFHVEVHPVYTWFEQCVTFNFFPTPNHELAYNLFNIITVYGIPLVVIIVSYTLIIWQISRKTRESKIQVKGPDAKKYLHSDQLRRSGIGRIERARNRTLKMTIVIVSVFILCWTPYFAISAVWWFDKSTAAKIDTKVQRGLFIFAVSNSCVNPIVYGIFAVNICAEIRKCCKCFRREAPSVDGYSATDRRPPSGVSVTTTVNGKTVLTAVRRSMSSESSDIRTNSAKRNQIKYNALRSSPRMFKEALTEQASCDTVDEHSCKERIALQEYKTTVLDSTVVSTPPPIASDRPSNGYYQFA